MEVTILVYYGECVPREYLPKHKTYGFSLILMSHAFSASCDGVLQILFSKNRFYTGMKTRDQPVQEK